MKAEGTAHKHWALVDQVVSKAKLTILPGAGCGGGSQGGRLTAQDMRVWPSLGGHWGWCEVESAWGEGLWVWAV